MFLRATKRKKDGKTHLYWSLVESVRVGRRVFQRQALYLGELNDSQKDEWQRTVEAFDEKGCARQLKLFPEDRAPDADDDRIVRIRMDRLSVRNLRNWGEVWLGMVLWDMLGLDGFWARRLPASRKGTDWLALLKAIVMYRFTAPGSELQMHSNWLANTAVEELIGRGALTGRSTLYACLDRVLWPSEEWKKPRGERKGSHKDELFYYLRDRWAGLFGYDIKELGKQLKKLGMLIVQDQVWGRVTANRSAGKATRYYMDEFHLLLKEEQTAAYSVEIWKRFRKWGGIPTGITQNVKDLLSSHEVENIFENSDFVYMLNQAAGDRQILAKQLNISQHQLSYVTHSGEGEGLLFYGNVILPFVDRFPQDTELYRIMTTKLSEVTEAKEA